jgi:hypothetical protein
VISKREEQSLIFKMRPPSLEKLYRGIDKLRETYGQGAIGAATPRNRAR